ASVEKLHTFSSAYHWVPSLDLNSSAPLTARLRLWAPSPLVGANFTSSVFTIVPASGALNRISLGASYSFAESIMGPKTFMAIVPPSASVSFSVTDSPSSDHCFRFCLSFSDAACAAESSIAQGLSNETRSLVVTNPDLFSHGHP